MGVVIGVRLLFGLLEGRYCIWLATWTQRTRSRLREVADAMGVDMALEASMTQDIGNGAHRRSYTSLVSLE